MYLNPKSKIYRGLGIGDWGLGQSPIPKRKENYLPKYK
jgi:hypothetical protein